MAKDWSAISTSDPLSSSSDELVSASSSMESLRFFDASSLALDEVEVSEVARGFDGCAFDGATTSSSLSLDSLSLLSELELG